MQLALQVVFLLLHMDVMHIVFLKACLLTLFNVFILWSVKNLTVSLQYADKILLLLFFS